MRLTRNSNNFFQVHYTIVRYRCQWAGHGVARMRSWCARPFVSDIVSLVPFKSIII